MAFGEDLDAADAMRVAGRLRARGRSVEYSLGPQKLARQLKTANTAGARHAVLLSAADRANGAAVVRDLGTGTEERVTLDRWIETLLMGING